MAGRFATQNELNGRSDGRSDPDAALVRELHDQHGRALWAFVLPLTGGDRGRTEDVVQETLIRAWRKPPDTPDAGALRSWLFTVARNIVVDQWRAGKRRPEESRAELPETVAGGRSGSASIAGSDGTDNVLQSMMVGEALRQLSHDHRMVLLECYFRGSTAAQAAARLDVPVGTVKSRLHYGLHALRLTLQEMGVVTT